MHLKKTALIVVLALILASLACSMGGLLARTEPTTAPALQASDTPPLPTEPPAPTAPPTETATLPPPTPSERPAPTIFPTAAGPRPSPSPLHFQIFDEVWGAVNANYLYPDFNGLDWNAVRAQALQRIEAGMTDPEFYAMLSEVIYSLGDEHSTFFSPEETRQLDAEFAGEYEYVGIGVIHTPIPERGLLSIVIVFPGSPAEQAGLKPHDNILAVDGAPIFDEQGNRRDLLRGPAGTTIVVTVQTPGQDARQVTITRAPVVLEMPVPHQVVLTPAGKRIGYVLIPTFNENSIDKKIAQAIQELSQEAPLDGLILDNRHNGGGQSEIMLNTLANFVNGDVGYFVQHGTEDKIQVQGVDLAGSQSLSLVVLVGDGTVSFGEVFAGILQDLSRATIIGSQTNGNTELMRVFDFSDGSRAWIATAAFRPYLHPDQDWEATGIIPDIPAAGNWDETTFNTDPVIQAALKFFGG